jgi:NADH-quinone oxidoreductase subunit N
MLAFCLTVSMACLAGLPLSVGFLGKWLVLLGLAQAGQLAALVIALIAAACGFYYYFRPIVAAYSSSEEPRKAIEVSIPAAVLLVLLCAVVLVLGLYPAPLNGLLQLTGAPAAAALLR